MTWGSKPVKFSEHRVPGPVADSGYPGSIGACLAHWAAALLIAYIISGTNPEAPSLPAGSAEGLRATYITLLQPRLREKYHVCIWSQAAWKPGFSVNLKENWCLLLRFGCLGARGSCYFSGLFDFTWETGSGIFKCLLFHMYKQQFPFPAAE